MRKIRQNLSWAFFYNVLGIPLAELGMRSSVVAGTAMALSSVSADLLIYEKAQELAGENRSATIARALRKFVEDHEAKDCGFQEIVVKVGKTAYLRKRFIGRVLATGHVGGVGSPRREWITIYQTAKGKFAVHTKSHPGWWYEEDYSSNWDKVDWAARAEYRLDIYHNLDELSNHVPEELFEAAFGVIEDEPIEDLDI